MESAKRMMVQLLLSEASTNRELFMSKKITFEQFMKETRSLVEAAREVGVSREMIEALLKA